MSSKSFYCRFCGITCELRTDKCSGCGAFNALVPGSPRDGGWVRGSGEAELIEDIFVKDVDRIATGTRELDRVLSGGFALEGAYILSGSPGAGKSTLLLQVMSDLCDAAIEAPKEGEDGTSEPWQVLIVAAEETKGQIAGRWRRLMTEHPSRKLQLHVVNQNEVLAVEKLVAHLDPDIVVVDSAQTMTLQGIDAPAGSATTVKAIAVYLTGLCKARECCLVMIAHVTKEDELAGPKMFEHLVDGVLHLSDEPPFRVLRMSKHRFGPTTEVGIFAMTPRGLKSVENPSELLLSSHLEGVPGSVVAVTSDATEDKGAARALLCEVQALRRPDNNETLEKIRTTGLEQGRVQTIAAVLGARAGFPLWGETIAAVAGGLHTKDPGLDLPVALAIVSASLGQDLPEGFCCYGEIGLAGEIRSPRNVEGRIKSALAMKVSEVMGPPLDEDLQKLIEETKDEDGEPVTQYTEVRSVLEAFEALEWQLAKPKPVKKTRKKGKKKIR